MMGLYDGKTVEAQHWANYTSTEDNRSATNITNEINDNDDNDDNLTLKDMIGSLGTERNDSGRRFSSMENNKRFKLPNFELSKRQRDPDLKNLKTDTSLIFSPESDSGLLSPTNIYENDMRIFLEPVDLMNSYRSVSDKFDKEMASDKNNQLIRQREAEASTRRVHLSLGDINYNEPWSRQVKSKKLNEKSLSCNTTPDEDKKNPFGQFLDSQSHTFSPSMSSGTVGNWNKRESLTPSAINPPNDFKLSKDEITRIIKQIHMSNADSGNVIQADQQNITTGEGSPCSMRLVNSLSRLSSKSLKQLNHMKIIQWYCCQCGKSYGDLDHFHVDESDISNLLSTRSKSSKASSVFSSDIGRTPHTHKYSVSSTADDDNSHQLRDQDTSMDFPDEENETDSTASYDYDWEEVVEVLLSRTIHRFDCARCNHMMCPYCVKARLSDLCNK
ncbi:hypothetical protein CANARDRAFT_58601 [[Candida] arabinofermentans NRRL YB-2248]|uniref:Uncharacterized protein n=1 Tax=[Candida] arabinofermentans NRRL YB-2248 TaxID=983967 RepID=A0A1E4T925_9ASCO|nr:hypothetical protein CANARDRAFT_58601 [[Candida] arabinofermentans NRRL YB-2248]